MIQQHEIGAIWLDKKNDINTCWWNIGGILKSDVNLIIYVNVILVWIVMEIFTV